MKQPRAGARILSLGLSQPAHGLTWHVTAAGAPSRPAPIPYLSSRRGLSLWHAEASPGWLLHQGGWEWEREAKTLAAALAVPPG